MNFRQVKGIVTGNPGKLQCPENTALVRKCAAEGMVKNTNVHRGRIKYHRVHAVCVLLSRLLGK